MPFPLGPQFHHDGTVTFHLWAPKCGTVKLCLQDAAPQSMISNGAGQFSLRVPATHGTRYAFELPLGERRPDPCSRFQPDGAHGQSELIDPEELTRSDADWQGVPRGDLIIYELHIGTFTVEGTYLAAIDRLDELVELGVTAIELMPLAQSGGRWNWGYDGVQFFAPQHTLGRPEELRNLIAAAHARGLAVILDVVYNHFGPEGNYLHDFGGYISEKHRTPWGDAPNFDGEHAEVTRAWILENVRYWIEDFHFDGLRLDAIHCIADESKPHIAHEIGTCVADLRSRLQREIHLIAESNVFDAELLAPLDQGGCQMSALWCDDFLHSVFAQLRPGEHRSSREYTPHDDLELVLTRGYIFESTFLAAQVRVPQAANRKSIELESLVCSIQHHDFIGNHPDGLRLHQLTSPAAQRAAAALLLLSPSIPMLFMGEEFASDSPFLFFVDFEDENLRRAVENGRREEHPQHNWSRVESPTSPAAFTRSKIGPAAAGDPETRQWYRDLIRIRKQWLASGLLRTANLTASWDAQTHTASLEYQSESEQSVVLVRLHPANQIVQQIERCISQSIILSQNTLSNPNLIQSYQIGPFGVVIGIQSHLPGKVAPRP